MIKAVIFDMFETLITHYRSPLYFGTQMAEDAGIRREDFQALWEPTETDRSIGKVTFEEVIAMILKQNHCYSKELLCEITRKRIETKRECFRHLHREILPKRVWERQCYKFDKFFSNPCIISKNEVKY